jgi:hypothetical protein
MLRRGAARRPPRLLIEVLAVLNPSAAGTEPIATETLEGVLGGMRSSFDLRPAMRGAPLLVAFGGIGAVPGKPVVFEFVNVTERLPASRLFVRDPHNCWYHRDPGIDATAEEIASIVRLLRPSRTVMTGNSAGGYAALLFGALLGVDEVHAIAPRSFLGPVRRIRAERRWRRAALRSRRHLDGRYIDLAPVLRPAQRTRFDVYFDSSSRPDRVHAQHLAETCELHGFAGGGHFLARHLRDTGALEELLDGALHGR